jgi:hypothetical protein
MIMSFFCCPTLGIIWHNGAFLLFYIIVLIPTCFFKFLNMLLQSTLAEAEKHHWLEREVQTVPSLCMDSFLLVQSEVVMLLFCFCFAFVGQSRRADQKARQGEGCTHTERGEES